MFSDSIPHLDDFLRNFRFVDALDIAVIAVILYAGLVWFKQTASRGVVVGVTVLTVLYFVARTFDMYLTSLVFHTGFAVLVVVLVVLFQEEIRRAFERIAEWGTLRELRPRTTAFVEDVDSLVESVFSLAAQKTGALIVLTGKEPLKRHLDGGIELYGRMSKPIFYSIFDSSSAGHDGAVILERDRIQKFGVHLPISKNHREIRGRGTRHSAALGISELSDALTIVVSEERGVVSVAERGKLIEVPNAANLKGRVEKFLEDRFPQKLEETWRRFVTRDIRWKLLSIALAVVAWIVLAFSVERVQTSVVVPIEYRNMPELVEVTDSTPADALVTLSGSERAFRLLDRRELKISIDLAPAKDGSEVIPIRPEDVRVPVNLSVDRIQPSEIRVQFRFPPPEATPPPATNPPK